MYQPAFTLIVWPVMYPLLASITTTSAISSTVPNRPTGIRSGRAFGLRVTISTASTNRATSLALEISARIASARRTIPSIYAPTVCASSLAVLKIHRHVRTGFGQCHRSRPTNAPAGTGYEGYSTSQFVTHNIAQFSTFSAYRLAAESTIDLIAISSPGRG